MREALSPPGPFLGQDAGPVHGLEDVRPDLPLHAKGDQNPVPGGLSLEDVEAIIRGTGERFRVRAATVATFTPERDQRDRTLLTALRVIELVGECALGASRRRGQGSPQ